jgi:hypothetical protein
MEELVDAMAAVSSHHAAVLALCVFLNHTSGVAEEHARFHDLDGFVQALPRSFHHSNSIGIRSSLVADVVGFVQVAVESAMVQRDINVYDVPILEGALIRNAVANDLVY